METLAGGILKVMRSRAKARSPISLAEVALAAVVAAYCVTANALATTYVEPLSRDNLGPLALAYHERRPPLALLPLLLLLLLASTALPGVGRAAAIAFVGAAYANIGSAALWPTGVPDYIVFRNVDVIANLSDLVMLSSATIILASILGRAFKGRRTARPEPPPV